MPIYEYLCEEGHSFDRFLKMDDYQEPQTCDCGAKSKKIIKPTMLNCDMQNWDRYESPCSGKLITSYKEREADMKEHGCVDYDPGVREDSVANQKRADEKIEKEVDRTVEAVFEAMPARKKEKLESELKHSELEYQRATV
jgi:putative FmdB family regulatory protein